MARSATEATVPVPGIADPTSSTASPTTTSITTSTSTSTSTASQSTTTSTSTPTPTKPSPAGGDILSAALRNRIPKLEPRRRRSAGGGGAPSAENATPVPETPALAAPSCATSEALTAHTFATPRRRILSQADHALFLASPTCTLLQAWVFGLADSVADTPAGVFADVLARRRSKGVVTKETDAAGNPRFQKTAQRTVSSTVEKLLDVLDEAEQLVAENPPDEAGGSRFGNKRFRGFVDAVRAKTGSWHRDLLGLTDATAAAEAGVYLGQAFGNRARIDYGSGHELHFVVWLLCLYELGLVTADDRAALVLVVFARYLEVMRLIQTTYYLEPAGSHGVWGLDDYQFLPFLFGAAQLLHHRYITPRAVHQALTLEQFGDDYLYLGQVRFVNSIKVATAPDGVMDNNNKSSNSTSAAANSLRWHSPMLDDISAARSWAKIEGGMRRMFVAEVLRKLPVMQHFLFGSLVPAADGMTEPPVDPATGAPVDDEEEEDEVVEGNDVVDVFDDGAGKRHIHNPSGWGDCCGIRVPSSLGAAGELRKHGANGGLRRIPFD